MTEPLHEAFENSVRTVARSLWPRAQYGGSMIMGDRERDGIFETEDAIHVVEATTSRMKDKAVFDLKKTAELVRDLRTKYQDYVIKGWLVTADEPTPHQREAAAKYRNSVTLLSFEQFGKRLVNAIDYLSLRNNYHFGSARNPENENLQPDRSDYIELDIAESGSREYFSLNQIVGSIRSGGGRFVIIGDYGAGKSMTLREIYYRLAAAYQNKHTQRFPIYLNLRDHQGQSNVAEALHRHGNNIGFPVPSQLVRAWRAGYADLILDGFDELATYGWAGPTRKLSDLRYIATNLIRNFVGESPAASSICIAGREHYFDSREELSRCLLARSRFQVLSLSEFTDEQIKDYVRRKGLDAVIPDWLPSRPLLVGYLLSHGLLSSRDQPLIQFGAADGWDHLLDKIASREERIDIKVDGASVRRIIERLSTLVRTKNSLSASIYPHDIEKVFFDVCGFPPDAEAQKFLMRLPGLGASAEEDRARKFVDSSYVQAAAAGDFVGFVQDPYSDAYAAFLSLQSPLDDLGVSVAVVLCGNRGVKPGNLHGTIERTEKALQTSVVLLDLVQVLRAMHQPLKAIEIAISQVQSRSFFLNNDDVDLSAVSFEHCMFGQVELDVSVDGRKCPKFFGCMISEVIGRVGRSDLPIGMFDQECIIEHFGSSTENTSRIQKLDLSPGELIALSILDKLFMQKGSGRLESALVRGLDHKLRRLVPDVLRIIRAQGFAVPTDQRGQTVWMPIRAKSGQARKLLAAPSSKADALLSECRKVSS